MPNPTTIEELLKMKPCPFEDGVEITKFKLAYLLTNIPHVHSLVKAVSDAFENNQPFKMPDGYYYLPPDKQLGLPLGLWLIEEIRPFIDSLPYGVFKQYDHCATNEYGHVWCERYLFPYNSAGSRYIKVFEQPPNLYNPLDPKKTVLMETNNANEKKYSLTDTPFAWGVDYNKGLFEKYGNSSANESKLGKIRGVEQPILPPDLNAELNLLRSSIGSVVEQPTPTELPWQDISTFNDLYKGWYVGWRTFNDGSSCALTFHSKRSNTNGLTHWLPITPPKALTVEAPPVEPERVSVQEFANSGYVTQKQGFWVNSGHGYFKLVKDVSRVGGVEDYNIYVLTVIAEGHPIYATDPSAWLAWKAEQEGKSV